MRKRFSALLRRSIEGFKRGCIECRMIWFSFFILSNPPPAFGARIRSDKYGKANFREARAMCPYVVHTVAHIHTAKLGPRRNAFDYAPRWEQIVVGGERDISLGVPLEASRMRAPR